MQPGVHPNGLFWTTEIPWNSVYVNSDQTRARLILRDFPLVDTIEFGALTAVNGAADIRVDWYATGPHESRGLGNTVPATDPGAFTGSFAEARCTGRATGKRTGFAFRTDLMDAKGFYAQLGDEKNGVFL